MKPLYMCFVLILSSLSINAWCENGSLDELGQLRWENRVVVLKVATSDELKLLRESSFQIDDRDIIWFAFENEANFSGSLRTNYQGSMSTLFINSTLSHYGLKNKNVMLIGKDGGVKLRADVLDLNEIFSLIDTMPMRIQEMQPQRIALLSQKGLLVNRLSALYILLL